MAEVSNMKDAAVLYRKVEARLEEKKAAYETAIAKDKEALSQIELIMLQMLKAEGVRSMNVPDVATVKVVDKRTFGCASWDEFYTWVVVNNKPELLQKRLHEANVQAFIDENKYIPPNVNVFTVAVVKVLKST